MDAKTLFQEGVVAIRDHKDAAKGRELLMQSLKIEPKNEMAWLWLSRTMTEPAKKVQCLERALKLNPSNEQTKALIGKLNPDATTNTGIGKSAVFTSATVSQPTAEMHPETPPAEASSRYDWNDLRVSTDEMEAAVPYTLTPNVSADMEDMGLTPDLSAVLTPASDGQSAVKRATSETAAITNRSTSNGGLKDLRAMYGEAEAEVEPSPVEPIRRNKITLSTAESANIKNYLSQAQSLLNKNKIEEAIEQWVRVLEIEVDNEAALSNAVRYLSRLKYIDDARELVWNAINDGTTHPSIFLTAIDIAKYQGHDGEADDLRLKLVQLPDAGEKTVMGVVDHFVENMPQKALQALDLALPNYPKNQKILFRRAQLAEDLGLRKEAATYYEEAAQLGSRSKEGQLADKKLTEFMPHMSDRERGSIGLAIREAIGVGFLYLLMAFQDAGLNLMQLGIGRVGGIAMSIIGGYLLVTAASSPQQKPLASWLGGTTPAAKPPKPKAKDAVEAVMGEPEEEPSELPIIPIAIRILFGVVGVLLLVGAFVLVFSTALALLRNPTPKPFYIPTLEDFITDN